MLLELIRKRYYSDIPEIHFWDVVKADPTSLGGKRIGRYSKWLFRIYRELPIVERFVEEDLPKVTEYLKSFDRYKGRLPENKRDINVYRGLPDLYLAIKPLFDRDKPITKMEVIRDIKAGAEKVYEDERWLVVIPHTEEAACLYGAHTQWCTAAREHNYFKQYDKQGSLYINIDKQNNRKYQFHFESQQFMDETDKPIERDILATIGATNGLKMFYKNRLNSVDFLQFSREVGPFSEGFAPVRLNGKWGFIDKSGREVILPKYERVGIFCEGFARVQLNGKWGYIDKNCREVIPPKYDYIDGFSEGFAPVRLNGKWGFIDKNRREVIPPKYDSVLDFSEGFARVKLNGKWGFIDKKGTNVLPCMYDNVYPFSGWPTWVILNGERILIDKSGLRV